MFFLNRGNLRCFSEGATPLIDSSCNDRDINSGKKEGGAKDCSFISAVVVSRLLGEHLVIT